MIRAEFNKAKYVSDTEAVVYKVTHREAGHEMGIIVKGGHTLELGQEKSIYPISSLRETAILVK